MKHERTKRAKRIEWNNVSLVVDVARLQPFREIHRSDSSSRLARFARSPCRGRRTRSSSTLDRPRTLSSSTYAHDRELFLLA